MSSNNTAANSASSSAPILYLIPAFLDERALQPLPAYLLDAVKECSVFFVENERSARRYLKMLWKEMVIDDYEWFPIHKAEEEVKIAFRQKCRQGCTIGLISEAGCPGIADPGQILTEVAHQAGAIVRPLVGPSSILLALMASGMNGQQFRFAGYLPVDITGRAKALKDLEQESHQKNCTQIFIETPYRNNQLIDTMLQTCRPTTRLCIAANLTGPDEFIRTRTIAEWTALRTAAASVPTAASSASSSAHTSAATSATASLSAAAPPSTASAAAPAPLFPDLHKQPAIFCLLA